VSKKGATRSSTSWTWTAPTRGRSPPIARWPVASLGSGRLAAAVHVYRGGQGAQIFVTPSAAGASTSYRDGRLNTSASYSPDGRDIVCSLSQDGNSEIYLLDARGGNPRRLTDHRGIDTSPAWSPTGQEIAFTSDRGAAAGLRDGPDGGNLRRLTYELNYTDSPAWSPRGIGSRWYAAPAAVSISGS